MTPPTWFLRALAVPVDDLWFDVDGCRIHALAWGEPGRRGIVFVHGGGAHAHWWTHVAAPFADQFRVVALDMSGHGDSGTRTTYSLEQWTDEVMVGIHSVCCGGEGALAQLLDLAMVGDVVALELASRAGIDPGPTPVIVPSPAHAEAP